MEWHVKWGASFLRLAYFDLACTNLGKKFEMNSKHLAVHVCWYCTWSAWTHSKNHLTIGSVLFPFLSLKHTKLISFLPHMLQDKPGTMRSLIYIAKVLIVQDLDVDFKLQMKRNIHTDLMQQLQSDAKFLEKMHVMDYSLLLGMHYSEWGNSWNPVASTTVSL